MSEQADPSKLLDWVSFESIGLNANDEKRYRRVGSAMPQHIVHFALVVGDATGHLPLPSVRRQYLYANIDHSTCIDGHVSYKEVVGVKGILVNSDFDGGTTFDTVCRIVVENGASDSALVATRLRISAVSQLSIGLDTCGALPLVLEEENL